MFGCRRVIALGFVMVAVAGCAPHRGGIRTGREREREQEGGPAAVKGKPGTAGKETPMADWFVRQRRSGSGEIPERALSRAMDRWTAGVMAAQRAREAGTLPAPGAAGQISRPAGTADGETLAGSTTGTGGSDPGSSAAGVPLAAYGTDAPGSWVFAGPNNIGGRITTLGVDPTNANTLWLGSADGGVWRSTDAGVNWSYRWNGPNALSIGALVVHPSNGNIVYVGTGEDNGAGYSYDGEGVFKTTDGGASWTYVGLAEVRRIGKMAIDPTNGNKVFVAAGGDPYVLDANRGVYRTTDGGANWTKVLFVANDTGAIDVVIDPTNPQNVYAATWTRYSTSTEFVKSGTGSRIYKSSDGGTIWSQLTSGLPPDASAIGRIGLAIAKTNPQILYAWYSKVDVDGLNNHRGIFKTSNGGSTWTKADTCNVGTQGLWKTNLSTYIYYFGQIRVDPNNAAIVYLMDVDFYKSTNSACSFTWSSAMHSDHHDIAFVTSSKYYIGGDGGFWTTTDTGANFTQATTIGISQFYDLGIDPTQPLRRFGGLQDNYVVRTITGGLNDWEPVIGGDGLEAEVDPTNSNLVYGESQYGNISRSTDGGANFSIGYNGIGNERTNWKAPLTHDPHQTQKLYAGTLYVYRTTDGAQNWQIFSQNLTDIPALGYDGAQPVPGTKERAADYLSHLANVITHTVSAIGVSPVNTNIVWAGTDDGNIWVDANGDGTWDQRNIPGRDEWVTRVTADPFDANTAYATLSGFRSGSDQPHIFRTTNLGLNWTDITGSLPAVPLNDVVPDPAWKGRLFVATDLGVWVTDDWGATWSAVNGGLPVAVVQDLDLVQRTATTGALFAGTFARSMWTYDLAQLPPPDRDGDGVINVDDCAPDDAGSIALPAEVQSLQIAADRQTLTWTSTAPAAGSGTVHNVLRGLVTQFPVGSGAGEICLATTLTASATDTTVPTVSQKGFWYLVRGRNTCGGGTYGTTSSGAPRTSATCP